MPAAIGAALLSAATLIAYLPAIRGGYVWDDDLLLTENPNIRTVAGLVATWTDPRANTDYYPLTHTSWWLEHRLFGLDAFVFHLDNVLLHLANGLLFWLILRRLAVPGAAAAAALFLLHPLHVESVAWVAERKNVLSGLFCLLAVWSFLRSAPPADGEPPGRPGRPRLAYGLSLLFFVCAMLAKPMTMAAAAVLPLLLWYRRGRLTRRDALAVLPFFAAAVPMAAVTIWVQYHHVGAGGAQFELSAPQRLILAGRALWFYAGKLAWPRNLTFAYPKWTLDAAAFSGYLYPLAAAGAFAALALLRRRIGRGPAAAAAVFAIMLSPALGFLNVYWHRYYYVADHMPYLASLGPIALACALAQTAAARLGPGGRRAARFAAAAILAALATLTWRQGGIYRDAETIWTDTLRKNPDSWMANNNLGNIRASRGEAQEAIHHYREALRVFPDYDKAHNNLALLLLGGGQAQEALRHSDEALRLNPDFAEAHYSRARALDALGRAEEADREYRKALGFPPD